MNSTGSAIAPHVTERENCGAMASGTVKSYTGASLEFEKLPINGLIHSITVGSRRFELDPPVAIEAGQRVADLVSVDVLFSGPDMDCLLT